MSQKEAETRAARGHPYHSRGMKTHRAENIVAGRLHLSRGKRPPGLPEQMTGHIFREKV
jgi:hypothetical protein